MLALADMFSPVAIFHRLLMDLERVDGLLQGNIGQFFTVLARS
jgi:hypothetical protein